MHGTTEPVIAVIGSPIAGNPSQFAIERALASMQLDWRVLSFEVATDKLGAALDGIEVLGFRGLLADDATARLTATWYRQRHPETAGVPDWVDCLYRDPANPSEFAAAHAQAEWLVHLIDRHFARHGRELERSLGLGSSPTGPAIAFGGELTWCGLTPEPEQIEAADLIILADDPAGAIDLESDQWPINDASTLVVDMTPGGHADAHAIAAKGYRSISTVQRRVGALLTCLRHWTGREPNEDVIQDAIEEFLAV